MPGKPQHKLKTVWDQISGEIEGKFLLEVPNISSKARNIDTDCHIIHPHDDTPFTMLNALGRNAEGSKTGDV